MNDCYRLDDHWALTNRHHHSCDSPTCRGCEECHRHCTCRKACPEHINPSNPLTAPACIGRTRNDIKAIIRQLPNLIPEAIVEGIDSEAAMLAGPALNTAENIEANGHRQFAIARGRIRGDVEPHDRHPLIVLGWWDSTLRQAYGNEAHLEDCADPRCHGCKTITEAGAAAYIDDVLDRVAQDPNQEFSKLASEIRACKAHLEVVLHNSRRPETGAPCPTCTAATDDITTVPALRKVYADHNDLTARIANRACDLGTQYDETTGRSKCPTCRGDNDTWQCPNHPDHVWSEEDYRRRVDSGYLVNATALTATQFYELHQIPTGTIRRWASATTVKGNIIPPRLRPAGRSPDGRNVYDVKTVLELREATTGRGRKTA